MKLKVKQLVLIRKIRKAAIEEAKRLKKAGQSITTNAVEVVCRKEDLY